MQRKNYILNSRSLKRYLLKRSGMAMIMAISVIVIVATIMALALSLTSQTTKRTTDLYLYEQAVLLSQSAAEYALLKIADAQPCTYTGESFIEGVYNISINVSYVYDSAFVCGSSYTSVVTNEQNGSVLMDIRVDTNASTEPITFFRRSIQKL